MSRRPMPGSSFFSRSSLSEKKIPLKPVTLTEAASILKDVSPAETCIIVGSDTCVGCRHRSPVGCRA